MSTFTITPTSFTTPDPGLGGSSVTGASNTGHAATTALGLNGTTVDKTCIWQSFPAAGGQILGVALKLDWTEDGALTGAGSTNQFLIQYSINGGGAWTDIINHSNITSASGPTTASVTLSVSQDLTQVRVRDFLEGHTNDSPRSASVTGTVANIKIEVTIVDGVPVCMW